MRDDISRLADQQDLQSGKDQNQGERASAGALALLIGLTGLGQLATNIVVPGLHAMGEALALGPGSVGLIMSMVLLGLASGQLVAGPLSDWLGRKPVLVAGLGIYVIGSLAATFAQSGGMLLAARFVQGFGASAGLALTRAIARDRYKGAEFLRVMGLLTMALAVTPGVSPILGGVIVDHFGWRLALGASVIAGAVGLAFAVCTLRETHIDRQSLGGAGAVIGAYLSVLKNKRFLAYALISGAAIGGAYAEISGAPRFYAGIHGWGFSAMSLATASYAVAAFMGGAVARSIPSRLREPSGLALLLASSAGLLALGVTRAGALWPFELMILVFLSQLGMGMLLGCAIGSALMAVERAIGTASAALGAIHMVVGALGAAIVTALPLRADLAIAVTMFACALASLAIWLVAPRH